MTNVDVTTDPVDARFAAPDLTRALEGEPFRRFLDQVPIAIVVAELKDGERIVYANPEFEKVSGHAARDLLGASWSRLSGRDDRNGIGRTLGDTIPTAQDFVGTFRIDRTDRQPATVDAYSHVIADDRGVPCYRLAALVDVTAHEQTRREELEQKIREKETRLLEIQHRVKNNLQMIAILLRMEARSAQGRIDTEPFDRLAGRIQSMQLLYALLSDQPEGDEIDLGVYLGEITTAVMRAHAVEGIRLDLKVDTYPVSVNVAMPTGLVVNELLTNTLKHAFVGRDGGTITLHSLSDQDGCRIVVADDGVGLPEGATWPKPGKLSALIVETLRENAKARVSVESRPGKGLRVSIVFKRSAPC